MHTFLIEIIMQTRKKIIGVKTKIIIDAKWNESSVFRSVAPNSKFSTTDKSITDTLNLFSLAPGIYRVQSTSEHGRHRMRFCGKARKIRARRSSRRRREGEKEGGCAAWSSCWQWLTGCVFALGLQPWKLVESRRWWRRCCLLPMPVFDPRGRGGTCTFLAAGRTCRARGNDLLPSSLRRHPRPLPSSPSSVPYPGKILLQRLANAKHRVSRDSPESCPNAGLPPLTDGPAEAPTSFLPSGPHKLPTVSLPSSQWRELAFGFQIYDRPACGLSPLHHPSTPFHPLYFVIFSRILRDAFD